MVAFVLRVSFTDMQQKGPALDLILCGHCLQILNYCEQATPGSPLALGPENCVAGPPEQAYNSKVERLSK